LSSSAAPPKARTPAPRGSLPELLLAEGKVSKEQVEKAMAEQRKTGAFLGDILVEAGVIDEKSFISFLAKYCKIPHLSLLDYLVEKEIAALVPREVCLQHRLLPIDKLGRNLTVAMVNPLDAQALDKVRQCCPDLRIKPILCAHKHFAIVTKRLFDEGVKDDPHVLSASSLGLNAAEGKTEAEPATPAPVAAPAAGTPDPSESSDDIPEAEEVIGAPEPGEALLDRVFHRTPAAEVTPPAQQEAHGTPPMVRDMTSAMVDSMRDTYGLLARRVELFRDLEAEEVARIFARGITKEYGAGEVIFLKGDPGDALYVILGGEVEIVDDARALAVLSQGDMFGEMALISREPRSAGARALSSTSLLALNKGIIRNVIPRDVSVQILVNIVVTLSRRLRYANEAWTAQNPRRDDD